MAPPDASLDTRAQWLENRVRRRPRGQIASSSRALAAAILAACTCFSVASGCSGDDESSPSSGEPTSTSTTPVTLESSEIDRLRALGYLAFGEEPEGEDDIGVVAFDRERSMPGYNIYTTRNLRRTDIIDAEGNLVHTWRGAGSGYWARGVLLPDGDLMVVGARQEGSDRYLQRLAWDGSIRWRRDLPVHHDVTPTPGGGFTILALAHRRIDSVTPVAETRDDRVVLLTDEGIQTDEYSFYDMIAARPDAFRLQQVAIMKIGDRFIVDLFHANSVFWMSRVALSERNPLYSHDHLLVSMRHQNRVAIFDLNAREAVWSWGEGELLGPHDATILPGGNLLVFDNGLGRGWSRVLELDPLTKRIVWSYQADPPETFYTASRGACQRLANGNTLITESDRGRAFEVTPEGEIVWEFRNPHLSKEGRRATMVRLYRLDPSMVEPLLGGAAARH
jgi:hypothetical protein